MRLFIFFSLALSVSLAGVPLEVKQEPAAPVIIAQKPKAIVPVAPLPVVPVPAPAPPIVEKVALSLADALLLAVPYADQTTRFLWLGDDLDNLNRNHALIAGHVNHLSTESNPALPLVVPKSGGQLLRINVDDYGPAFRASWDRLGEQEPYFHVKIAVAEVKVNTGRWETVAWPGGKWEDGKVYKAGSFQWQRPVFEIQKAVNKVALAPWLAKSEKHRANISKLLAATGSQTPIVSGSWFLWQSAAQQDRSPGYYDFLGIKKLEDLEALAGYDAKIAARAKRTELLEAVAVSGVSRQPRRIGAFPALDRKLWKTFDSKLAVEKHNPLRVLDNDNFQFDANEIFYGLPNGLWGFGLFAANGDRQNVAPDFVGHDATSTSNDARIHAGISCIRCHYPNGGINPVDAWARQLFRPPLALKGATPEIERDLRAKYLRDLETPMARDRAAFGLALKEISGLDPKDYATAFRDFWRTYESAVTLKRAAREIGVTAPEFKAALLAYVRENGQIDPILGGFLREMPIPIYQWHEIYSQAQEIVAGYKK